jgi:dTDP-D-glucose 4,6-dehydratase
MALLELNTCVSWQFIKGDITSTDFVLHILKEEKIDTVLNFAAQARAPVGSLYLPELA